MKSFAIHQHDDWYLINLPGLRNIPKERVEVDVQLTQQESSSQSYKDLRGDIVMERYQAKREREELKEPKAEYLSIFDSKFGTGNVKSIEDILKLI